MSQEPHIVWQICFWICFVWSACFIPIAVYYLMVYIKHRDKAFFGARMSNCTIVLIAVMLIVLCQRIFDAFIGIGYINHNNIVNTLFNFLQLYPVVALYCYKYVIYHN